MKKTIFYIFAAIFGLVLFALPKSVFAVPSGTYYKDWNQNTLGESTLGGSSESFCENTLFANDKDNIYAENICSLSRVIGSATVDFATKITCQIQATPDQANYAKNIKFEYSSGRCAPSNGLASGDNVFGNTSPKSGFYNFATSSLTNNVIAPSGSEKSAVQKVFEVARNITTILAFLVLIIVAFANILHFDINTYAVKKALPTLIIALVGGWLSIYVVYLLSRGVDFLYSISWFSPYQALHPMQNIFGGALSGDPTNPFAALGQVFGVAQKLFSLEPSFVSGILGTIFLLVPAIVVFVFEYLMALRPLVVEILTAIAPIAFLTLLLPQTQALFKKWWTILLTALLFAPIVNLIFFIMNQFSAGSGSAAIFNLALMLFKTAIIVFLIRLPFTFESDFRNLSVKISKSGLGEVFGLRKGQVAAEGKASISEKTITDKILQNPQAQKVIAGIEGRRVLSSDKELRRMENIKTKTYIDRSVLPQLSGVFAKANDGNLNRSGSILARSVSDIAPETFKKIIQQSDLRLWQDPRLVSELKGKNGQVLDDQGAAIRADAVRKLVRLAQIVEGAGLQNPEAIKTLAAKGALDNLPYAVVQKAIKDGVLSKSDLIPTYGGEAAKAFDRLQSMDNKKGEILSSAQARALMNQDQKDYSTGFKDMVGLFSNVVKNQGVIPPPPPSTIKDIVSQMKSHGSDVFESNGMYYLERLGKIRRDSESSIVANLQKAGASVQTATAIARNPRLDLGQIKDYVKTEALTPESLNLLREGFINRDLSNEITSQIATQIYTQKKVFSDAVCNKLAQNLKEDQSLNFDNIKNSIKSYLSQQSVSPEQAKSFAEELNKYYPGATIQTAGPMSQDSIEESKSRAQSVLDTLEGLNKAGINEKNLATNPAAAKTALQGQMAQAIQKAATGNLVASDSQFNTQLGQISANKPGQAPGAVSKA